MRNNGFPLLKCLLLLVFSLFVVACTSIKPMPDNPVGLTAVDSCNIKGHMMCVYLTGKETLSDGFEGKWTRHWFRMSYIGKACEQQYNRTTAVILESLFAIPHYSLIAIGNGATAIVSPFFKGEDHLENPGQ